MINIEEKIKVNKSKKFSSKQMSIDPEFTNKIIWLVINQYKYKIRTSLQELISNAIDAQVDANNTDRPLKISLPTKLEPTFKLRDYGTGMTPEVINKIYSSMGASGSSHTNDKKGGFGIGGKSPLGFCDQYTIRTIVNGTQWTYIVHKNALGGIDISPVGEENTNEENGTEIIIPSSHDQIRAFKKGAVRATYFWDTQPTFNTDDIPVCPSPSLVLSDNAKVYADSVISDDFLDVYRWNPNLFILVDGIPYKVERSMIDNCPNLKKTMQRFKDGTVLTYAIGNGQLKVLQTREALEECQYTYDKLEEIALDIKKSLLDYVSDLKKPTLLETYKAYGTGSKLFTNLPVLSYDKNFKINTHGLFYDTNKVDKTSGNKINYLFQTVEYTYRSKRGRYYGKNANSRRVNFNMAGIKLGEVNKFCLDDLSSESEQSKARRCKHFAAPSKNDIRYIKTDDMPKKLYNFLLKDLGLEVLSSLPLPPKAAKRASKGVKKLANNLIDIHLMEESRNWRNRLEGMKRQVKTITLSQYNNKVLWCDYSTNCNYFHDTKWVSLLNKRGYQCAYISKKYQKDIENKKNFVEINKFMESFKISDLEIEGYIQERVDIKPVLKKLMKLGKKSGNKRLTAIANDVIRPYVESELPKSIRSDLASKHVEEIDRRSKEVNKFEVLIKVHYPSIGFVKGYHWANLNMSDELALQYIIDVNKRRL